MSLSVTFFIVTLAICCGIFNILIWHFRRRRLYILASKFDGPPVLPIVGNAHLLMGNNEFILNKICELYDRYASPFRFWFGPILGILVADPEHVKSIFLSPKTIEKPYLFTDFCQPFLGTGLLAAPVAKWKVHRKLIQPTFNPKILDSFVQVFASQAKTMTELMKPHLDGPEFEVFDFVSRCTLDMICETAMGVKVEAQMKKNVQYTYAIERVVPILGDRYFRIWLHPDFVFYRSQLGKDQQKYAKIIHDFTDEVIQTRRNELLRISSRPDEVDEHEDDTCGSRPRREAFLDHLIKLSFSSGDIPEEALRAEVDTMVFGGNDTCAIENSYILLMLASHPDIQEKLYQELYDIYGDSDVEERPIASKDLPRMKYLERVVKETLRLFPVAPYLVREATDDLDIGGHTIPKGSLVTVGVLSLHRSEKYWTDPLAFNPDRFLPEEVAKRHPYTFMTFSGGPRNCIGLNYAMMAMKTLIATFLRAYIVKKDDIVPVKDIRLTLKVLLKPVEPIKIRIERRMKY